LDRDVGAWGRCTGTPRGRARLAHRRPGLPHVSSVAFAGPGLDTLVVTTAAHDLTDYQLARFPDSGRLFAAAPGVKALPQAL
jgi:sugar lactone lactonase YvrE